MRRNAHIKKRLSESHELREIIKKVPQKKKPEKHNKMQRKKSIEPRAKLEESAILQHEHGRGMDAPGIYVHDNARERFRDFRGPKMGRPAAGSASLTRCAARRQAL